MNGSTPQLLIGRATVEETAPAPEPLWLAPAALVETITDEIAGTEIVGAQEIAANNADGGFTTLERFRWATSGAGGGISASSFDDVGLIVDRLVIGE